MAADIERLSGALVGRYRFERELGRGAMATVYLAVDVKHRRSVAIKVLNPELGQMVGPERFLREIEVTARLDHPHILPLLDSGEAAGLLYYVMPYVEGESLRERLNREKQLPLEDALQITQEVADALSHAHGRGIVHRDIKPENILLAGDHARVADFGISRAVSAAGGDKLTATGLAIGTPAYMSPEQASEDVDGRSDIYSLGCVLYEMLAGDPPFTGSSAQVILARKSVDQIPSLRTVRESLPLTVERAVEKALARMPADRFATPTQFAEALKQIAGTSAAFAVALPARRPVLLRRLAVPAIAAVGLLALGVLLARSRGLGSGGKAAASDTTHKFVILADFDHAPADSQLAISVTETLWGRLQGVPRLFLPDRRGLQDFLLRIVGVPLDTRITVDSVYQIAQRSNWHGVVAGSVRRVGPGFILSVQLRPTVPGPIRITVSETAEDSARLVAAVARLGDALSVRILEELHQLQRPGFYSLYTTRSLEALQIFQEGQRAFGANDKVTAVRRYREAVRLDSTFGWAHRRLWASLAGLGGLRRAELVRSAEAAYHLRDQGTPRERFAATASYLQAVGRREEAIAELKRMATAFRNTGFYGGAINNMANIYEELREYELSESLFRGITDTTLAPFFHETHSNWIHALIKAGRLGRVDSLFARARAAGSDTGSSYQEAWRSRLIAERRYPELGGLRNRDSATATLSDSIRMLRIWRSATAVLGAVGRSEDHATRLAEIHRDLEDNRGVLLQALWIASLRVRLAHDSAGARQVLVEALARIPLERLDTLDRPYPQLASLHAELGQVSEAENVIRRWEREVRPEHQGLDREGIELARGDVAVARSRPSEALGHYRRGDRYDTPYGCSPCNLPRFAHAWDRLGNADSAIATYERYLDTPAPGRDATDGLELALAYIRLGELYEGKGNVSRAVQRYGDLLELWRNADRLLQPIVTDIRQRVARLAQR